MNAYFPRQQSYCRESGGTISTRSVQDAHCAYGWQQNFQGRCFYPPQPGPPSTSDPAGLTLAQPRTKVSTSWNSMQDPAPKQTTKAKGAARKWRSDCTYPPSWYQPVKVSLLFLSCPKLMMFQTQRGEKS